MRALSVEDDPFEQHVIEHFLSHSELPSKVVHARTVSEALERLRSEPFDVILLDLSLPDAEGLDTLARVQGAAPRIPIVVVTGNEDEHTAVEAMRAGAQDYVLKPRMDRRVLVHAVRFAIERQRAAQALAESEARVRAIVNTAPDAIITFDEHGSIAIFNPAAEPLFGYAAEEMIGSSVERILPGILQERRTDSAETPHLFPASSSGGALREVCPLREETAARRSDGATFEAEVALSELRLGDYRMFTVIVRRKTAH